MVNACRFYGIPCPDPETEAWEEVLDFAKCRNGTSIPSEEEMAEYFGLRALPIDAARVVGQMPVLLTVVNPEVGHSLHAVLVVGWSGNVATVLNYRVEEGPVVERVRFAFGEEPPLRPYVFNDEEAMVPNRNIRWDALYIPKPPNDRCFVLEMS
jgi:hypothetical protein